MHLIARIRARLGAQHGFTMIAAIGVLTVLSGVTVAAFAAAGGDLRAGRYDQDSKRALAAAEAGVHNYLYHLNQDNAYWAKCTNVAAPHAVNDPWNGVGADPRRRLNVPGSDAQYTIELLPVAGHSACNPNNAQESMIDSANGGSFKIRATGFARNTKRTLIATFKRRGFLDYLYFTDLETSDPTWYKVDTHGKQTREGTSAPYGGDLVSWAQSHCSRYYRLGRGDEVFRGQWYDPTQGGSWRNWTDTCTEILFANQDQIEGPLHTNDELYTCGGPDFGRNSNDKIENSGADYRKADILGCDSPQTPDFIGEWVPNAPLLQLPPTDSALKRVAGYVFTGKTTIVLGENSFTANGTSLPYPETGVIYVQNGTCGVTYDPFDPYNTPAGCADVYVRGAYGQDLTIASEKDIIVNGDTTRSGDRMLGLIANNFIRIYHPVSNLTLREPGQNVTCSNAPGTLSNLTIHAAMLSLQHSVTVDSYFCGPALGNLTVNGAIGQKYRGPVGKGGVSISNGYQKKYTYDDRLRYRSPPHFLDPVQSSWRLQRMHEQAPSR